MVGSRRAAAWSLERIIFLWRIRKCGGFMLKKKKKIRVCRKQEKWRLKTRDDCLKCEALSKKKKIS